ncbi:MAG TPA: hypothetical protein PLO23_07505 [Alphaproteobacteria bacterium]|nr:hypothetical protein [Alphaproteobacteria bacterium]
MNDLSPTGSYESKIGEVDYFNLPVTSLRLVFTGVSEVPLPVMLKVTALNIFGADTVVKGGVVTHGQACTAYVDIQGSRPLRYQNIVEALAVNLPDQRVMRTNEGVPGSDAYIVYIG